MRSALRCFGFVWMCGAAIAPVGDHFHVARGVTEYLTQFGPVWLGNSPLWFVLLCSGYLAAVATIRGAMDPTRGPARASWVYGSPLLVLGVYLGTSFYPWREGGSLEALCYAVALLLWAALDRTRVGLGFAAIVAATATAFELALVQLAVIRYLPQSDELAGVAPWLPALYFVAAVSAGVIGQRMCHRSGARG